MFLYSKWFSFLCQGQPHMKTLVTGQSEWRLYLIPVDRKSINKTWSNVAPVGVGITLDVWHARLGHPSSQINKGLVKSFNLPISGSFDLNSIFQSCLLGKSKQLPFGESCRVTLCPLELVHSNVWVSSVMSNDGHWYYVLFINDFSRFTWVYPLHNKFEVFSSFVHFKIISWSL